MTAVSARRKRYQRANVDKASNTTSCLHNAEFNDMPGIDKPSTCIGIAQVVPISQSF